MDDDEWDSPDQYASPRGDADRSPDEQQIKALYAEKARIDDTNAKWDFHELVILLAWLSTGFISLAFSLHILL